MRGNVLVIPIEDSIIYVEPVYITTSNQAAVPEVKRIIVAYGDKVVMRETLAECLDALFGKGNESENTDEQPVPDEGETTFVPDTSKNAVDAYDRMQQAFKAGDWAEFGEAMEDLGLAIESLR
ncbi:MAG: hypothetical protein IJ297_05055 [Clostridia bacterium]|nr:hypothetical protein [Clostridia bacterium]